MGNRKFKVPNLAPEEPNNGRKQKHKHYPLQRSGINGSDQKKFATTFRFSEAVIIVHRYCFYHYSAPLVRGTNRIYK